MFRNAHYILFGCLAVAMPSMAASAPEPAKTVASEDAGPKKGFKGNPFQDTKLVAFRYNPNETYPVLSRDGMHTVVEVDAGEKIMGFYLSDTVNWESHVSGDQRHVLIKPSEHGLFNAATIITDKRTYLLAMTSSDTGKWYQRVKWNYPEDQRIGRQYIENFEVRDMPDPTSGGGRPNFEYDISGNAGFRPLSVYDNGKFTWIVMPKNIQELPALFSLSGENVAEVVNYTIHGNSLLVNRLMSGALLKLGSEEVRITSRTAPPRDRNVFGWGE